MVGARLVPYKAPVGSLDSTDAGASASQVDVCLKAPGHPSLAYQLGWALLPPVGKCLQVCACKGVPAAEEDSCRQHICKGGMANISDITPLFYDVLSENKARSPSHQDRLTEHWALRKIKKRKLHSVPSLACRALYLLPSVF